MKAVKATIWERLAGWLWRIKYRLNRKLETGWEWLDDEGQEPKITAVEVKYIYKYGIH